MADLWSIEKRILAYLDQRGGQAHRNDVVGDLADPNSRIGQGIFNGSNAGVPRIMGSWCRRLVKRDFVRVIEAGGFYRAHGITPAGRQALRGDQDG